MSRNTARSLKVFGISMGLCLALAFVCLVLRADITNLQALPEAELYRILCDAFTIPGLLVLMFALLFSVGNMGALDGVGYVAVNALKMLIPGGALKMERYNEYLERRRANRMTGFGMLYVSALICLGISAIFLVLFYSVYQK